MYVLPHKADTTVICQCGAIICKYYMPKHLRTVKHERDMYVCMYVCMYLCVYVYIWGLGHHGSGMLGVTSVPGNDTSHSLPRSSP
jgi:hypothetical protein